MVTPTRIPHKRPPPSPIVAPIDDHEEEEASIAAAEEGPPPKFPRLDDVEGHDVHAAAEGDNDVAPPKFPRLEGYDVHAVIAEQRAPAAVDADAIPSRDEAAPPVKTEETPEDEVHQHQPHVDDNAVPSPLEPPTRPTAAAPLPPPSPVVNPINNNENVAAAGEEEGVERPLFVDEETAKAIDMAVDAVDVVAAAADQEEEGQPHELPAVDNAVDIAPQEEVQVPNEEGNNVAVAMGDDVMMLPLPVPAPLEVDDVGVPAEKSKEQPRETGDNMAVDAVDVATKAEEAPAVAVDDLGIPAKAEDAYEMAMRDNNEGMTPTLELPVLTNNEEGATVNEGPAAIKTANEGDQGTATTKKVKKERKEFTAEEKLRILDELNGITPVSIQSILQKYNISKSSLHRWRQPEKLERLQEMVKDSGDDGGETSTNTISNNKGKQRKRDMNDKLLKIKIGLQEFCKNNLEMDEDHQLAITSSLIQLKAVEIRDELLKRHEVTPGYLTEEEVVTLQAFKGSKSWACLLGNQLGYLSTAGAIVWSEKAKANTATYLDNNSLKPSKSKKQRVEFTAMEKLAILQELEKTNKQNKMDGVPPMTVEAICEKYQTSKSSLHRWKQQYRSGELKKLAKAGSGFANSKRIFIDKLQVIKNILNDFYLENENAPMDKKIPITYSTLQSRAIMAKESLLERHHAAMVSNQQGNEQETEEKGSQQEGQEGEKEVEQEKDDGSQQPPQQLQDAEGRSAPPVAEGESDDGNTLTKEEVNALEHFKASTSWLRETAKKFGWKMDMDGKRDSMGSVLDGTVMNTAAAVAGSAIAYHHADHQHAMVEQPLHVQHHGAVAEHPMAVEVEHPVAAEHPPVMEHPATGEHPVVELPAMEHHGMAQVQMAEEQRGDTNGMGSGATAVDGHQQHDHTPNGDLTQEGHQEVANDDHHQQQQPVDHLAPNMAVYDAQGNVRPEMLEDPLDPMERSAEDGDTVDQNETAQI